VGIPSGIFRGIAIGSFSKKGEFKSEAATIFRLEIPGVVPPFGLKVGMTKMIAREFIVVARKSGLKWSCDRR
jgi:hypothetical protein